MLATPDQLYRKGDGHGKEGEKEEGEKEEVGTSEMTGSGGLPARANTVAESLLTASA
ncbi:MAG: hypothetical protein HXY30_09400 [Pseudorhodoplanes sp.]|nr:hypothetical protein [Pseudorhodoplanes sp.]